MGTRSIWLATCFTLALPAMSIQGQCVEDKRAIPERLFPFHEGGKEGKWGYINWHGQAVVPPRFIQASDFSNGLARIQTETSLGYVDAQGKIVFTLPEDLPPVEWTLPFTEGRAAFCVKSRCGYFDRRGNVVVGPKYDDAKRFSEGLAAVNLGAESEGFPDAHFKTGGTWGFIDETGRLAIPMQFSYVDEKGFSDGLVVVRIGGTFAYIDKTGQSVITPEYKSDDPKRYISSASHFSEGLARVDTSGHAGYVGFIDKTGKFAIAPRLDGAGDFSEGLTAVLVGKKWGYMDRAGRIVITPQFEEAQKFSEGLAAVRKGERWSYIDKQGKLIITGRFNDAEGFNGGLARVHEGGSFAHALDGPASWSGGVWFYIDEGGKKVHHYRDDGEG